MERYGGGLSVRKTPDPSHYGQYQVELAAEIPGNLESLRKALESLGYVPVDFDQWGLTYASRNDPDTRVDVDELDDYGEKARVVLRKGRLSECDVDGTGRYLVLLYRRLAGGNRSSPGSAPASERPAAYRLEPARRNMVSL